MALHSRGAVTVSAAGATRSRADCSSMEDHRRQYHQHCFNGHTSLSAALVYFEHSRNNSRPINGRSNNGNDYPSMIEKENFFTMTTVYQQRNTVWLVRIFLYA